MNNVSIHPLIDRGKQELARRYHRERRKIEIVSYLVSTGFIFVLIYFGISENFVGLLHSFLDSRILVVLAYFTGLYIVYSVLSFPFACIGDYRIENSYGFSRQTFNAWFVDWLKSFVVGLVIGAIMFQTVYFITRTSPGLWWFWLSFIMIIFSVILTNLFPVVILPLFYKISPLENDELKENIKMLCHQTDIAVKGIFTINLSSKSTKTNAAVVGLGKTKRIMIGDNLISDYSEDEILAVLAHEITHYREHHIWWLILWQAGITVVMFFLLYLIYPFIYRFTGFEQISDIAAFPVFAMLFIILSLALKPIGAAISRYYERQADQGALDLIKDSKAFIRTMAKLCNKQLVIAYPLPLIEWYKYSHPSIGKRIKFAEKWAKKHNLAG